MLAKDLKRASLEAGLPIEREHQSRHQQGTTREPLVRGLVAGKIARPETFRQYRGLTEREAKTFAGDGIDRARGVADQGNISSPDTPELAVGRNRASFSRHGFSPAEPCAELGKLAQRFFQTQRRITRRDRHANFLAAHRIGISLAVLSPIYFRAIGPGRDTIVSAKSISQAGSRLSIKTSPAPHS